MPQIGPLEILVVAAVALIVFGPNRLPEMARSFGKTLAELKRQANEIKSDITAGLDAEDETPTSAAGTTTAASAASPSAPGSAPAAPRPAPVEADSQEP